MGCTNKGKPVVLQAGCISIICCLARALHISMFVNGMRDGKYPYRQVGAKKSLHHQIPQANKLTALKFNSVPTIVHFEFNPTTASECSIIPKLA